jgi:hypothetical protein
MVPMTPYAIFERAREVWSAQRYPATVAYTVVVTAARQGAPHDRHYHEYWRSGDNSVFLKPPVSDEQLEHPYKPSAGVDFMGWNIGGPREGTGVKDFIGPPVVAPNYSFGISTYVPPEKLSPAQLVAQIRSEYRDPAPAKVGALQRKDGLKTIAMVSSSARAYRISLVGLEADGTGRDYHLALQPLREPLRYRLRDLWIDTATFQTRRARIGGNFTDAATQNVAWTVRFTQIDGATYIASEDADGPIVGYHGLMYSRFTLRFQNVTSGALPALAGFASASAPLIEP